MRARAVRRFAICSGRSSAFGGSCGTVSFGDSAIRSIKPSSRAAAPSPPSKGVVEQPEAGEYPEVPKARARQLAQDLGALGPGGGEGLLEEAVDLPGAREASAAGRERAVGRRRVPDLAHEIAQKLRLIVHLLPEDRGVE